MRAPEAMEYLRKLGVYISYTTFLQWAQKGIIPSRRPGGPKSQRIFDKEELDKVARREGANR